MKRTGTKALSTLLALVMLLGFAALPAMADGIALVGEVTITNQSRVNIRSGGSTDYPIVATGNPGDLFQTTGQGPTGWYEILLPDDTFGFISNKMVYFYRYPNPIAYGAQYTIPVYYMTAQGQTLKTVNVPVKPGQNVITADDSQVPGYRLTSTRSVYVSVDAAGKAVPNGVIFNYEQAYAQPTVAPVVTGTVRVFYKDIYNQVIASEYRTLNVGAQLVKADISRLPQGTYITGASDAVVVVNSDGSVTPMEVNFIITTATPQTPPPATFSVPVSYRDEAGNVLRNTTAQVMPGYTTVTADDANVPSGMALTSARSVVVYASNQGVTFPSTVVFTYKTPVKATIAVVYRDNTGRTLYTETRQLDQGTATITADDSRVGAGYVLQSSRSVQVTVYQNGTVSQNQVVFDYAQPVSFNLPVEYRSNDGRTLYSVTRTLSAGTTTITADDNRVGSGYVLQSNRNVQVTVYQNGTANPDRVVFLYAQPVSATVSIVYKDVGGNNLFSETRTFQQGTYTITANDGRAPTGYVLQGNRNVQVTISSNGTASPGTVEFVYAPPAPPVTVNIPVVYKDQDGAILHQTSVAVSSAAPNTVTANKNLAPAGYVLSGSSSVRVTVSPQGVANPAQVTFTFRDPSTITEAQMLPGHKTFSYKGDAVPVYSGPGTDYWRAANGRAAMGGGKIWVWGTTGDWAMIGYGLSNNLFRIGYIQKSYIPADLDVPELIFGSQRAVVGSSGAHFTDDMIVNPTWLQVIPAGTEVTLLAYENLNNHWAYIETTMDGQPSRGFVNKIRISTK